VCTVIGTAVALFGMMWRHGVKQGSTDTKVSHLCRQLPNLHETVDEHENRITAIETRCEDRHCNVPR